MNETDQTTSSHSLFAVCLPGLAPVLRQEMAQLQLAPEGPEEVGGVGFSGNLEDIYRANLNLRTASRILLRLDSFYAGGFPELKRKVKRLPWADLLTSKTRFELRVTCHKSRLYHSGAVAERVAEAISQQCGAEPVPAADSGEDDARTAQPIIVRLLRDRCTVSIDTSGEGLHRRGYRRATAKAPLRETLAAGMLLAAGWGGHTPLLDPFCGSGTIAIEAALRARNIAPGLQRRFAFMDWPDFQRDVWEALRVEANAAARKDSPPILASDRDAGAIDAAAANAERAGVGDAIDFSCRAFSTVEPPAGPGWIVTNPPYGKRISEGQDLRNLYAKLGQVLRSKCPGWRFGVLCGEREAFRHSGLSVSDSTAWDNGGIKVWFQKGVINSGLQ